ncbi:hypothetical protein HGRIS_011705 [Hohenbuehelia grisea]|uniref:Uncharacterized protein n=1 Tax=Hohenbuehelia grisea TaxID=104357 RepID=A0ABR3JW42_9AGAR
MRLTKTSSSPTSPQDEPLLNHPAAAANSQHPRVRSTSVPTLTPGVPITGVIMAKTDSVIVRHDHHTVASLEARPRLRIDTSDLGDHDHDNDSLTGSRDTLATHYTSYIPVMPLTSISSFDRSSIIEAMRLPSEPPIIELSDISDVRIQAALTANPPVSPSSGLLATARPIMTAECVQAIIEYLLHPSSTGDTDDLIFIQASSEFRQSIPIEMDGPSHQFEEDLDPFAAVHYFLTGPDLYYSSALNYDDNDAEHSEAQVLPPEI